MSWSVDVYQTVPLEIIRDQGSLRAPSNGVGVTNPESRRSFAPLVDALAFDARLRSPVNQRHIDSYQGERNANGVDVDWFGGSGDSRVIELVIKQLQSRAIATTLTRVAHRTA